MRVIRTAGFFLLTAFLVYGQEFEVASIKPSGQSSQGQTGAGLHIDDSMARYSALSLNLYLGMAYSLKGNYDFTVEFSPEDFRAMIIRAAIAQVRYFRPKS